MQDDVNKTCVREKREGVGCICSSCGPQLGLQGIGLFSVDSISVAGAGPGPEKVHNCSTNNCPTL